MVKKPTRCPNGTNWDPDKKKCMPCPGSKIRSKGRGRGLGTGQGKGPIGVPPGGQVRPGAGLGRGTGGRRRLPANYRRKKPAKKTTKKK